MSSTRLLGLIAVVLCASCVGAATGALGGAAGRVAADGGSPPGVDSGLDPDAGIPAGAGRLEVTPPSLDLGTVDVGATGAPATITVRAVAAAVRGVSVSWSGASADFEGDSQCTGTVLAAGASCAVTVTMRPASFGAKRLQLVATGAAGERATATVSGVGRDHVALSVERVGDGSGTVRGEGGIDCGTQCTARYERTGEPPTVRLTAAAAPQARFVEWAGCTHVEGSTCLVTLIASARVVARFAHDAAPILTVRVERAGAGGRVTGPGIDCAGTCTSTFARGVEVTLTAEPEPGARLLEWAGACAGTEPTCVVRMTGPVLAVARFRREANLAFVSSATWEPWELNGLAGADAACQQLAANANLPGNFVAWLSSSSIDAAERLRIGATGVPARGWVRADGLPFVDAVADLMRQPIKMYYPLRVDENGTDLRYAASPVMTGTTARGERFPATSGLTCGDWSERTGMVAYGSPVRTQGGWTDYSTEVCSGFRYRLYCFEVDYAVPVAPAPVPVGARVAFVSSPFSFSGGGVQELDATCTADARAAGIQGRPFRALVATPGRPLFDATRFNFDGQSWYRPDGIVVFSGNPDTMLSAPIALDVRGERVVDESIWTGVLDGPLQAGELTKTCGGWRSTTGVVGEGTVDASGPSPLLRRPDIADGDGGWYLAYYGPCAASGRVYCADTGF